MAKAKPTKPTKAKKMTKSAIYQHLAEQTELPRKKIAEVFDALAGLIRQEITNKKGAGEIILPPGLIKVRRFKAKATKPRKVRNPRTGEETEAPGKPERWVARARALKALREIFNTEE